MAYQKESYQKHKIERCKKLLEQYAYRAIERVKEQYDINIDRLALEYTYTEYLGKHFRRLCYRYGVKKSAYLYDECFDACQLAYLYSLYRCSISPKRTCEGYISAYIKLLMRIHFIAALTVANESGNICRQNNFKQVSSEDYQV